MKKTILSSIAYSDVMNFKKKRYARYAVKIAIKSGKLIRAEKCELCNEESPFIEAHHKDYGDPLNVNWLCRTCHCKVHSTNHPLNPDNHDQTPLPYVESHYKTVTLTLTLPIPEFLMIDKQAKKENIAISSLLKKEISNIFKPNNRQIEFNFEECDDHSLQIKHA